MWPISCQYDKEKETEKKKTEKKEENLTFSSSAKCLKFAKM